ncbi:MAG: hypothetical protein ACPGGN_00975 [Opitutales bacterium]
MLRFIYQWRHRRAHKTASFEVPSGQDGSRTRWASLASYMSQASVRGRSFDPFDRPQKRRRNVAALLAMAAFTLLAWVVTESIFALELFRH